jgi:hypothetical protein
MEGQVNIKPADLEKLKEVITLCNNSKRCTLELLEAQGGIINISFNTVQEIFILGRVFQEYKPPIRVGSITWDQKYDLSNI